MDWDCEVEGLFQDLEEGEVSPRPAPLEAPGLLETLGLEMQREDAFRVLLVDYACELSRFFMASRTSSGRAVRESATRIVEILSVLEDMPGGHGELALLHQGRGIEGEGTASERYDYALSLGSLGLDLPEIKKAVERMGETMVHVAMDFRSALKILSACGVNTVTLAVRAENEEAHKQRERALFAVSAFFCATAPVQGAASPDAAKKARAALVHDERRAPDPNLTALAAVNRLKPQTVQGMVAKVSGLMRQAEPGSPLFAIPSVYRGIFAFRKLRDALVRPAIEINEVRWSALGAGEMASRDQEELTAFVAREYGKGTRDCCRALDTLSAADYRAVGSYHVLDRLDLASGLLAAVEKTRTNGQTVSARPNGFVENTRKQILRQLESRLKRLQDPVLDNIGTNAGSLEIQDPRAGADRREAHPAVLEMVDFLKKRRATRAKFSGGIGGTPPLSGEDFANLARDFGISPEEARKLALLLNACFAPDGGFLRPAFDKHSKAFHRLSAPAFHLLWEQLARHGSSRSRLDLLAALRTLAVSMESPGPAMDVLLDFLLDTPDGVRFPDRNALLLLSVFLHGQSGAPGKDTLLTPSGILTGDTPRDPAPAVRLALVLDRSRQALYQKTAAIHSLVRESLAGNTRAGGKPLRFLLLLEWELYTLLALAGGAPARIVLGGALAEYANPGSPLYTAPLSRRALGLLFPVFLVLVLGIARTGGYDDYLRLLEIPKNAGGFAALNPTPEHLAQVKKAMAWVERSTKTLERAAKPPEDDAPGGLWG
jgi:hypothetical protein